MGCVVSHILSLIFFDSFIFFAYFQSNQDYDNALDEVWCFGDLMIEKARKSLLSKNTHCRKSG